MFAILIITFFALLVIAEMILDWYVRKEQRKINEEIKEYLTNKLKENEKAKLN